MHAHGLRPALCFAGTDKGVEQFFAIEGGDANLEDFGAVIQAAVSVSRMMALFCRKWRMNASATSGSSPQISQITQILTHIICIISNDINAYSQMDAAAVTVL